jgi:hypothetical protein
MTSAVNIHSPKAHLDSSDAASPLAALRIWEVSGSDFGS